MKSMNTKLHAAFRCLCGPVALAIGFSTATADQINVDPKQPLPRPDDKAPDATRKVKVFILMGQSNMVGMGDIGPENEPGHAQPT